MTKEFLVHCCYCGYNSESDSGKKDQKCPECGHRASQAEPVDESDHVLGEKTNYIGKLMDETENKIP